MIKIKERPILFSAPMVRAIRAGTKTQTRRVVKPPRGYRWLDIDAGTMINDGGHKKHISDLRGPYGQPGDRLWGRESFLENKVGEIIYRADFEDPRALRWRPSMFMPRWASRITLEVAGVRVERLQDISRSDAIAEGAPPSHPSIDRVSREFGYEDFPRSWYTQLWESINGPGSWDANPWVRAVEFNRCEQ